MYMTRRSSSSSGSSQPELPETSLRDIALMIGPVHTLVAAPIDERNFDIKLNCNQETSQSMPTRTMSAFSSYRSPEKTNWTDFGSSSIEVNIIEHPATSTQHIHSIIPSYLGSSANWSWGQALRNSTNPQLLTPRGSTSSSPDAPYTLCRQEYAEKIVKLNLESAGYNIGYVLKIAR